MIPPMLQKLRVRKIISEDHERNDDTWLRIISLSARNLEGDLQCYSGMFR
jgi:hypothetical protein